MVLLIDRGIVNVVFDHTRFDQVVFGEYDEGDSEAISILGLNSRTSMCLIRPDVRFYRIQIDMDHHRATFGHSVHEV